MTRAELLTRLAELKPELDKLGIASLRVFGSYARDEARPDSDIDLLVEFKETPSLFEFCGVKLRLEALLGHSVDLATEEALHRAMRDQIHREAIRAA
jgi:predicted nucleotidyltransferase